MLETTPPVPAKVNLPNELQCCYIIPDYFNSLVLTRFNSRVSSWGDEVDAAVHPGVRDALLSGDIDLLLQELLILLIDVLGNGLPAEDTKEKVSLCEKAQLSNKRGRKWKRRKKLI